MKGPSGGAGVPDPLAALRDGDPGPFEALVRGGTPRLAGFFRRLGAAPSEAEDLTQEVFLKLWQSRASYRAEERFGAFCMRVARNVWIDAQRRDAARPRALSLDGGAPQNGRPAEAPAGMARAACAEPGEALAASEEVMRLRRALRELSLSHRLAFELCVMQELSYAEVAAVLEVPVGTVKSRMFYAVRRLREAVAKAGALRPALRRAEEGR